MHMYIIFSKSTYYFWLRSHHWLFGIEQILLVNLLEIKIKMGYLVENRAEVRPTTIFMFL